MYERGLGPDGPSPEVAVYWFKEAARRGDVLARIHLGEIYRDGTVGRSGDPLAAYAWFELACQAQGAPSLLARAGRERDQLATNLGPKDVLEAAKRAQEWNLGMRGDL
jgi:TPR repeat protein